MCNYNKVIIYKLESYLLGSMFQYRKRFLSKTYWNYIREIVLPILQPEQQQQREESEHTLKKGSNESVKKTSNIGLLKRIKNGIRSNVDNKARRSTALDIKGAITLCH
jgi:hypothetical protein